MKKEMVQNLQTLKSTIVSAMLRMLFLLEESEEPRLYRYLARMMKKWYPENQGVGGKQTHKEVELITLLY